MRAAVLVIVIAAACGSAAHDPPAPSAAPASASAKALGPSNILRADYAGSPACADCHGAIYQAWQASPMKNMTRDAATAQIRAPFDGTQLHIGTDTITMTLAGKTRLMSVASPTGDHTFRITKVVGGRYREDFVGVEDRADHGDGVEHVLPATYVFSTKSWRYKGYSVMVTERPRAAWQGVWSQECIACHNTLPLATYLYDDLYGPKLPAYQGKLQDRLLPESRAWPARAIDPAGLSNALADEIRYLGGTAPVAATLDQLLPAAATTMEQRLDGGHVVELGIGCEACHNGAKAHAVQPEITPQLAVTSSLISVTPPPGETGTKAQWINHTCAKCHTVLFSRYPYTWEGGHRRLARHSPADDFGPGGSSISSGEGRDFQLGGCASQLACTTCHDPHTEDPRAKLDAMGTPAGNHLCVTCHAKYGTDAALAQHSHHKVGGAGSACIACHMAKKNMGLDYALDRYHRIGSPTDADRVERDRPLECALCHADKSVASLVTSMESWWGKRYDRAKLAKLYGDLGVNVMAATLEHGKAHEQAVAIVSYGDRKDMSAVPALVPMLSHEYPLVRYFALRALQKITGDPVAIDVGAPAADVARAANAWLAARH